MGAFLPWYASSAVILLVIHGGLCVDIIGGNEVEPHSRPFMAQIKGSKGIICGGALIKENWVLTAAHCKVEKSKVILGAHSSKKREKEQQAFPIAKDIPYPCYDPSTSENDIMLLQGDEPREFLVAFFWGDIVWSANPAAWGIGDGLLRGRAKLNKAVQPIPLPPSDDDPKPGTVCTVAGWGLTANRPGKLATALMEVNITVIRREICNDKNHYNGKPVITENMICAGAKNGKKDSCNGDSGGPLRCNNVMRGITSFGKPKQCGDARGPGVYTRLTKRHLEWIRKTIAGA